MFDPDISSSRTNAATLEREPKRDQIQDPQELSRVNAQFERNFREVRQEINPNERASTIDPRQVELARQVELRKIQTQEAEAARAREERQRAYERETRELADKNAKANFRDKNFIRQSEQDVQALKDKYGLNPDEIKAVCTNYMASFESRSQAIYNDLPWYKQTYYDTKKFIGDTYNSTMDIADRVAQSVLPKPLYDVSKAVRLTAEGLVKGAVGIGEKVGFAVVDASVSAVKFLTDGATWQRAGERISNGYNATVSFVSNTASSISSAIMSLGSAIGDKIGGAISKGWDYVSDPQNLLKAATFTLTLPYRTAATAVDLIRHPEKIVAAYDKALELGSSALNRISSWGESALSAAKSLGSATLDVGGRALSAIVDFSISAQTAMIKFGVDVITNPKAALETLKSVGSTVGTFLKEVSDDIGLTKLVKGCGSLLKGGFELSIAAPCLALYDLTKVATGKMSAEQFAERTLNNINQGFSDLAKGGQAVVGAIMIAGEITGISDVVRCVGCALEGDWKGAAMHGGFALLSIGSITATVLTAGAAGGTVLGVMGLKTIAQQGLKVAVKEGFEVAAKELGERAALSLTKEVLEVAGEKAAKATVQELNKELAVIAARKGLGELTPEIAQQLTKDLAEKHVSSVVRDLTEKAVKNVGEEWAQAAVHNPKQFISMCQEMGIEKSVAKDMQKAMAKGRCDKEIKNILCAEMEEPLVQRFRAGMKDTFEKNLDEGIDNLKKKYGFGDDVADGMKAGGREGFESGIRKGVREGLKKAWDEIFDDLRKKKMHLGLGGAGVENQAGTLEEQINTVQRPNLKATSSSDESTKFAQTGKAVEIRDGLKGAEGPGAENDGKVLVGAGRSLMAGAMDAMETIAQANKNSKF